jgi:uncharacterized protein YecT (DUF1311 family)
MRISKYFLIFFLLAAVPAVFSQATDPGAQKMCASVEKVELPAADRPTPSEETALAKCVSVDLYYGFGQPADMVKARKCAYAELDRGDKTALGGNAILAMIYANGQDVPRNYDVALKLACAIHDTPGDAAGRIYEIERLRKSKLASRFSICDHSSGRDLYEQCAILSERFDVIERDKKFDELAVSWNAHDKHALHTLLGEAKTFSRVQASNAIDLSGTFEIQEEGFLNSQLLENLQKFERGELPKFSAEEFQQAESAMNAAYLATQTDQNARWGTVTPQELKTSQEEWLRYRDAWIAFGRQKYPSVTVESWKTWLDKNRVGALRNFAAGKSQGTR